MTDVFTLCPGTVILMNKINFACTFDDLGIIYGNESFHWAGIVTVHPDTETVFQQRITMSLIW